MTNYKTLIPIAYGRTVTCPEDILAHLTVISADNTDVVPFGSNIRSQAIQLDEEVETLFMQKLRHYLSGTSHPEHPMLGHDIVPLDQRQLDAGSRSLRSRCFMWFATGSDLMPHGEWTITVCFIFLFYQLFQFIFTQIRFKHDFSTRYAHRVPTNTVSGWKVLFPCMFGRAFLISCRQPEPVPMMCHTCLNEVEITFNQTMLDFVREVPPHHDDRSIATSFDAWMHASILHTTTDYNLV